MIIWAVGGLPGTGKSTLARQMEALGFGPRYASDEVRRQAGYWGKYSPEAKANVYSLLLEKVVNADRKGLEQVIVEGTFTRQVVRDKLHAIAQALGADVRWVWLEADAEILLSRVRVKRMDSQAGEAALKKILREASSPEAPWLRLDTGTGSSDEILARFLAHQCPEMSANVAKKQPRI